ncbi:MAG: F0F1 ATP synthase subunit B [Xanthobacteraceae bacterium]|nr:MAG: F0F1 ATP synthase subunit B [Xanthobacteraceae bacterium]
MASQGKAASGGNAGAAHTEVPSGGHGGGFPPFDKSTFASQLFWLAIAFVALYVIVSRIALPRVGGLIEARRDTIAKDLGDAQRLKDAADQELATYESELAAARAKAQAIGAEMRDKLQAQSDAERKSLEDRLAGKLAEAEKTIAATRQAAMGNVRTIAADAAAAIVQRLTGVAAEGGAVQAAVDAAIKGA